MSISLKGSAETRDWLTGLRKNIPDAMGEALTGGEALARLEARAKADVEIIVYAVYSPSEYQRTFELLNAVGAVVISESPPAAGIVINLTSGVEAKKSPGVSYARFMLPEHADRSFLQSTVPDTIPRDFLSMWVATFSELLPIDITAAVDRELKR